MDGMESKVTNLNETTKKLDNLKKDIKIEENATLERVLKHLDSVQNEFLSLIHSRKLELIQQINRFYSLKIKY